MDIQLENITPEAAEALLDGNKNNRSVSKSHVAFLAAQMKDGLWKVTGDPVKISVSGRLLDGQHRLLAIVDSRKTIDLFVARNCPEEIFDVLDTGKNRSAGDVMAIAGIKNSTATAAMIRMIMIYEKRKDVGRDRRISNSELLDYLTQNAAVLNPVIDQAITLYYRSKILSSSEWGLLCYLFKQVDEAFALKFLSQLSTGAGLAEGSPLLMLRQKLEQAKIGRFNLTPQERAALAVKAWNLTRSGKTVTMLVFKAGEAFPEPI